jgi:Mg2+ and Co2+ transporter CorA
MKIKISEETQRMLMILKLDDKRLFERIKYRSPEYMYEFSLKRSRDHFPAVFNNRYESSTIRDLMLCGQEVIAGLDQFYSLVDEMRWYLNHTQDMPNRMEDKVHSYVRELEKLFETLNLYIDVEMGLLKEQTNETDS